MATRIVEVVDRGEKRLGRWRLNSPFVQTLLICLTMFCGPGMNTAVIGLGAGGSTPSNIPIVDKINVVTGSLLCAFSFLGGSVVNKMGPRLTLMVGASSYPVYIGSLWFLDNGKGDSLPYFAAVYHGFCSALFYSAVGYVITAYSPEHERGRYIGFCWMANALGSIAGGCIVLAITTSRDLHKLGVPLSVYATIISVQIIGVFVAALLVDSNKVKRNDGRSIAHFKEINWKSELRALLSTLLDPKVLLIALALFSCQIPVSFSGSINAFYYNARTRSLANLAFWIAIAFGSGLGAWLCDAKCIGRRRRRALVASVPTITLITCSWSSLLWFMTSHSTKINRNNKPADVDWSDGSAFTALFLPYICLACSTGLFIAYLQWICSSFSNRPYILGRISGYVEGMRALGLVTAFGIDSNKVAFIIEGSVYFPLQVVGAILTVVSIMKFGTDTNYGQEDGVIAPLDFENKPQGSRQDTDVVVYEGQTFGTKV